MQARFRTALTDLRYRLEYAGLRAIAALVRLGPLETATHVSATLWMLIAPRLRRHQRALANLAIAYPEKTPAERETIARAMWGNLGRVMVETMRIDRLAREPERFEFLSQRVFDRYRGKLGPAVGVTLHQGNWELAAWPFTEAGGNPAAIFRMVKNPYVDTYLRRQREGLFPGGLFGKGDEAESKRTARIMTDYVRKGGRLAIVSDLFDRQGIEVPFFGKPAKSVIVPAMIARRVGARIWMGRCLRVGASSRFQIEFKELRVERTPNQAEDIRRTTAAMQAQFEAWVREAPEQFMWSNRRWG
jgi:Kdo2-lipid IVA lauroyltransferase/acyltransferase